MAGLKRSVATKLIDDGGNASEVEGDGNEDVDDKDVGPNILRMTKGDRKCDACLLRSNKTTNG